MAMLADSVEVIIGVDTHKHTHTAAVVAAATGQTLATTTRAATPAGYRQLLELADQHPRQRVWAIEGTGGYGAGLTRFLHAHQEQVVELDRPKRAARRHGAKSDPLDATRAAREALGRDHLAQPRATGPRAALSVRLAARRSAVQAAGDAQRQLHALVIAAPPALRERLRAVRSTRQLVAACARLRVQTSWDVETATTAATLRSLARRIRELTGEAADHRQAVLELVRAWRPDLLTRPGVGPIVAATVLCAWSHAGRCRSDAAFAMLGGAAPIPASSGQTVRVRLNRSGDRQLNQALYTVVLTAPHRPGDPRLRPTAPRPGQDPPRDQALPGPLRRPPALPAPRERPST
jgi:transposase